MVEKSNRKKVSYLPAAVLPLGVMKQPSSNRQLRTPSMRWQTSSAKDPISALQNSRHALNKNPDYEIRSMARVGAREPEELLR